MSNYLGFRPTENSNYYFLSYNSEDASRVGLIATAMSSMGIDLWYDYGIEYGDKWETTITEKIKNSEAVLLFFTKGILQKENSYVQKEYKIATQFFGGKKIYVIMLDKITNEDVPISKISWWIDINDNQCVQGYNFNDVAHLIDEISTSFGIQKSAGNIADPAETYMQSGELYMNSYTKYAREAYRLAIDIYDRLPSNLYDVFLPKLALAHGNIAKTYIEDHEYDKAIKDSEKALELYSELVSRESEVYEPLLANVYYDLCVIYSHTNHTTKAIVSMANKAVNIFKRLFEGDVVSFGSDLAKVHCFLANFYSSKRNWKKTRSEFEKAAGIYEQLIPITSGEHENNLVQVYEMLCSCYIKSLDVDESLRICDKMISLYEKLCEANSTEYYPSYAYVLWRLGVEYHTLGVMETAKFMLSKSLSIYMELSKDNPGRYHSCINGIMCYLDK